MIQFLGRKIGMTRVCNIQGLFIPTTVIKLFPALVIRKKSEEKDGYRSVQLGFIDQNKNKMSFSQRGYFHSQNVVAKKRLKEVILSSEDMDSLKVTQELNPFDYFFNNAYVDVSGVSKGKGFCGVIKRHGFSRGPETHGSRHHREPGSVGSTGPSRIFKGKLLPGRKGNKKLTVQNLKVFKRDSDLNLIYLCGSVPGHRRGFLFLKPSIKKMKENQRVEEKTK